MNAADYLGLNVIVPAASNNRSWSRFEIPTM